MCGIVGILSPKLFERKLLQANELLIHRGPDDSGFYIEEGIGLAIRRLSIIDLEGGHQPISNEDQKIWMVCNGEIINALALRRELQGKGHFFRTQTDVEVILHAYEEWGEEFVSQLRGMFAFALWDSHQKVLLLARDPFGIKPLFYAMSGEEFAFASEIKPLFYLLDELPCQVNLEAIWRMFEASFIPSPLTPFQSIHELSPAHMLKFKLGAITQKGYWCPSFPKLGKRAKSNLLQSSEEFMSLLCESINMWRLSDVPVGSLLSGGIDSATVAVLLTEIYNHPIQTFTIGFNSKYDESDKALKIADSIGSLHNKISFNQRDFNYLPQIVQYLEEPQPFSVALPVFQLYQACHEARLKVIVTGEGSDELLAGYPWYQQDHHLYSYLALPSIVRSILAKLPIASQESRKAIALGLPDPVGRFLLRQQMADSKQLHNLLEIGPFPPLGDTWRESFSPYLKDRHPLDQFTFIESQTRLPDFINVVGDRMSMAHSVESRPVFLDHQLWDYVNSLPPEMRLSDRGNKQLLRCGMEGRLPHEVLTRPKKGLTAPSTSWWRLPETPSFVEDYICSSSLHESGYFNIKEVNRIQTSHRSRQENFQSLLDGILLTQIWYFEVQKAYGKIRKG